MIIKLYTPVCEKRSETVFVKVVTKMRRLGYRLAGVDIIEETKKFVDMWDPECPIKCPQANRRRCKIFKCFYSKAEILTFERREP